MDETTRELVALERAANDGWLKGDPGPALAVCAPDVTCFHTGVAQRIDGLAALTAYYERFRGMKVFDDYDIIDAKTQLAGDAAILTYYFDFRAGEKNERWNSAQVYRRTPEGWRLVHSHWSKGTK